MRYFNVTENEISKKLFNIFIGISLGNKLLTKEYAKKYVKWAYKNTKDTVLVLIADNIDTVNWEIFRGLAKEEAETKVKEKGGGIAEMFERMKRILAQEEKDKRYLSKVTVAHWSDIQNNGYLHLRDILNNEYKNNPEFKKDILYFVDRYLELRKKDVNELTKDRLAGYIIDELPTLLGGLLWNDILYNLILYPTYVDSGMSKFVLDIRGGKYFNSSKLLLRQICVLVEDYVEKPSNISGLND
jgi:tRNA-dependent cyclodipeptide synthase